MVKALKRDEVAMIGWSGDAILTDLLTETPILIRGSVSRSYNHSDFQVRSELEKDKMLRVAGGSWNWGVRPGVLDLKDNLIACSFHCYPHSIPVASGAHNIVSPVLTRENSKGPDGKWKLGSHFCLHYIDSLALRPGGSNKFYRDMNAAVHEAMRLVSEEYVGGIDMGIMDEIRKLDGLQTATESDVAALLGYMLRNSEPQGAVSEEFKKAVSTGVTDGIDPGMPLVRWQGAVMASRAGRLNPSGN